MKNQRYKYVQGSGLKARLNNGSGCRVPGSDLQPKALSPEPMLSEPTTLNPERGFSLIELLIASVITAMACVLLIGGLQAANRSGEMRSEQILATTVLANQLALLPEQIGPATPTSGAAASPLGEFTWTLTWTEAPLAPLVEATLTVAGPQGAAHAVTYRSLAPES